MPAIPGARAAVVTSTSPATIVTSISPTAVGPFETQPVELRSEILPFLISQLRLVDTFDSGSDLALFSPNPRAEVIAAKDDVPFRAIR
jgi:hypothetical protein